MPPDQTGRYQKGREILDRLDPEAHDKIVKRHSLVAREMVEFIVAFAYGEVYDTKRLDPLSRQVATIAALAALGNAPSQLKFHMGAALNLGMKPDEIEEIIYLCVVFAGFPAGVNAAGVLTEICIERGIKPGEPYRPEENRSERAEAALEATTGSAGKAVLKALDEQIPDLGRLLLNFPYGDVISRKVISPQWKEIAMISAAVAKGTMAPQLAVHLHAALNVGLGQEELGEIIKQMAVYAGFPAALNAAGVLKQVLLER